MGSWKTWLIRAAWLVASAGVGALAFPLLFFAIFNPAALGILAILVLGYGALLWSTEQSRHTRMELSRDAFLHEMFVHGLAMVISLVATGILMGTKLASGISM